MEGLWHFGDCESAINLSAKSININTTVNHVTSILIKDYKKERKKKERMLILKRTEASHMLVIKWTSK